MNEVVINKPTSVQYVVVVLGSEQYGVDIGYVDNIVKIQRITRVPKAQHYFKGVINIRGEIIPVMSLRQKFGLGIEEYTPQTRILIIKYDQAAVGIIVDEVREVVTIHDDSVDKSSKDTEAKAYLLGVGKHEKGLISLLNLASVIGETEIY